MWKTVLVGASALAVAASTVALAQPFGEQRDPFRRGPPTAVELQAFGDARLAGLKAGLVLTDEQAALWPVFEQAVREWQKLRNDRRMARSEQRDESTQTVDPAERLRRQGTAMTDTGAALKKLAEALDPLYKRLDENQKHRFAALNFIAGLREAFAGTGGRDNDRRGFGGRDERDRRDQRLGRDFREDFRGDLDGSREGRERRDYRDEFRDGYRGGERDFREGNGRDRRDYRDNFPGRDGYEPRGFGRSPYGRGG